MWKKIRRKLNRIFDAFSPGGLAEPAFHMINGIDRFMDFMELQLARLGRFLYRIFLRIWDSFNVATPGGVSSGAAKCVQIVDRGLAHFEDVVSFLWNLLYQRAEKESVQLWKSRKTIMKYLAGALAVGLFMIGAYNSVTGFEYSYNGKALGIVNSQEDVVSVLEVARESLTKEYGLDVEMDAREDFSYRRVVTYGQTVDTSDDVLDRLSYMKDTGVTAWSITADGRNLGWVNSKESAQEVLALVQDAYIGSDSEDLEKYESIGWKEKVKISRSETKLNRVRSVNSMVNHIMEGEAEKGKTKASPLLTLKTVHVSEYYTTQYYKTEYKNTKSLYKGDTEVSVKGKNGKTWIRARITKSNGKTVKVDVLESKVTKEPVTKVVLVGTKERPSSVGDGNLINPVPGARQTSGMGWRWGAFHQGVDLACSYGTPIMAADGGVVVESYYNGSYGNEVLIDHQNGMKTRYAHMASFTVSPGDKVYEGEVIGYVGMTGYTTGPHLHFEVYVNDNLVNPRNYF